MKQAEPEVVRQVISEDTAREVWAILENVVSNGTGKPGKVDGYKVAGKTGDSRKGIQQRRLFFGPRGIVCRACTGR